MSSGITGRHLDRRAFLRGAGAALALPLLDAMTPAFASTRSASPLRMAFTYVPNGVAMENWTPLADGAAFELTPTLEPIVRHKDNLLVVSGLTHNNGRALGDGAGDHARAAASYLTGVHPKKTAGADIRCGISVDQIAAAALDNATPYASLELTCEAGRQAGSCDSGYSCAYSNSISWRTPQTPNPPEHNPRHVFERLFGAGHGDIAAADIARRRAYRKSIIDFVSDDTNRLMRKLGPTDRNKLDEYLFSVRKIEQRIEFAETMSRESAAAQAMPAPEGVPDSFADYVRLMFDLQVLALQTDQTRVITFMIGGEGSNRSYPEIGAAGGHHELSHHLEDPEKVAKIRAINKYHVEQFGYFLDQLRDTPEGDGTLLDHCMIVYGSGLSDGNAHRHEDLPVLIAGRGCGTITSGRHVRYPVETPMTNLYVSLLDRMGVPADSLGDSTGELGYLSGI
jgi:hypothetical protein